LEASCGDWFAHATTGTAVVRICCSAVGGCPPVSRIVP
jgi:hypothetical protein